MSLVGIVYSTVHYRVQDLPLEVGRQLAEERASREKECRLMPGGEKEDDVRLFGFVCFAVQ